MITVEQYFRRVPSGQKLHTAEQEDFAEAMLFRVNQLVNEAVQAGAFTWPVDPDTGCQISGARGGAGDGGFRAPDSTTGAPNSSHREGKAVDVYDPANKLDDWLTSFETLDAGGNTKLVEYDLYREAPHATIGWCHLTTRRPGSGKRTFLP